MVALQEADRFEPAQRPQQEGGRGHQPGRAAAEDGMQHPGDQAQVVGHRQPGERDAVGVVLLAGVDPGEVVEQVAVADHRGARVGGRAGGVLQERHLVGIAGHGRRGAAFRRPARRPPPPRSGDLVAGADRRGQLERGGAKAAAGEDRREAGVAADRLEAPQPAAEPRRARDRRRHRHPAGPQATPEGFHQLEAGREKKQGPLARRADLNERRRQLAACWPSWP